MSQVRQIVSGRRRSLVVGFSICLWVLAATIVLKHSVLQFNGLAPQFRSNIQRQRSTGVRMLFKRGQAVDYPMLFKRGEAASRTQQHAKQGSNETMRLLAAVLAAVAVAGIPMSNAEAFIGFGFSPFGFSPFGYSPFMPIPIPVPYNNGGGANQADLQRQNEIRNQTNEQTRKLEDLQRQLGELKRKQQETKK